MTLRVSQSCSQEAAPATRRILFSKRTRMNTEATACLCQNLDSPHGDFPKSGVTFGGPNNKDYRTFEVFFGVLLSVETTTLRSRWMPSWVKKKAQPAESPKHPKRKPTNSGLNRLCMSKQGDITEHAPHLQSTKYGRGL